MFPPSTLHRTGGCALALSPNIKIFLSGSVLFLGTVGALPFFQANQLPTPDKQPVIAAIPNETAFSSFPVSQPDFISPLDHAPAAVAVQTEKYAKAYPEPILASEVLTSESVHESTGSPPKVPTVSVREFKPIHRLAPSPKTSLSRQAVTFDERPECIDAAKLVDSLLPMFHFAENLKPLSPETVEHTLPENPFQPPDVPEDRKLSPLRPYVELRQLRLPEKK